MGYWPVQGLMRRLLVVSTFYVSGQRYFEQWHLIGISSFVLQIGNNETKKMCSMYCRPVSFAHFLTTDYNTLATWCEELTHLKRFWCWERLKVGGEGDDRGWDGWMASPTQWTWIWVNFGSWWWIGRAGELQSMGLQRAGHDWETELRDIKVWK